LIFLIIQRNYQQLKANGQQLIAKSQGPTAISWPLTLTFAA
jgi:hypothetical protein